MRVVWGLALGLLLATAAGVFLLRVEGPVGRLFRAPDPVTIAEASLEAARRQAALSVFAARFSVVVTSEQRRFGLAARKTMIVPGTVRYMVDLSQLSADDLQWDAGRRLLVVSLPPLRLEGPEIDLGRIQEYREGGVLMALTRAEDTLDQANREAATRALLADARAPLMVGLASESARLAVGQLFRLPLEAAGVRAEVEVRLDAAR